MITYFLSAGLGHCTRFAAILESLRNNYLSPVYCLCTEDTRLFLKNNLHISAVKAYNIYHYNSLVNNNKKKTSLKPTSSENKVLKNIQSSSIMLNDFITNVDSLKKMLHKNTVTCCVYHTDIEISKDDDTKTAAFKKLVTDTASRHDIFFHINLKEPTYNPNLTCTYVPIPIITRKVTMNTSEVKKLLGLDMLDKFILVHYGSAVMENMYKDLFQFKNAINNLKTDYKIVVADSLQNNKFKYKNHIITAPLFSNGIDLVNASEMVISKPGMGVLQDCIASRKPLLFLPGDFPERDLKIKLLNSLFEHEMPFIREITSNSLEIGIRECLRMSSLYEGTFSKVQKNGAHIIAKTIEKLSPSI